MREIIQSIWESESSRQVANVGPKQELLYPRLFRNEQTQQIYFLLGLAFCRLQHRLFFQN